MTLDLEGVEEVEGVGEMLMVRKGWEVSWGMEKAGEVILDLAQALERE